MSISIKSLSKIYPGGNSALKGINLEIGPGIYGLLGPNGAGKSTLMNILTTILKPSAGEITIFDRKLRDNINWVREITGYLPQEFGLYKNLNAVELLDYIALFYQIEERGIRQQRIEMLLDRVGLSAVRDKKIKTYSGGMKRRLGIAQALINNPRVLIVDEPTAGLDPEERVRFRKLLRNLIIEDAERIVIISTHIINDITALCSKTAILNQGSIAYSGDIKGILELCQNKVWQITADREDSNFIEGNYQIVNSIMDGNGSIQVRYVGNKEPLEGSEAVKPTLEDAYILLISEGVEGVGSDE